MNFKESIEYLEIIVAKKLYSNYLLSNKPGCYLSARKTQITERIFKMNLIHASVIYLILWSDYP